MTESPQPVEESQGSVRHPSRRSFFWGAGVAAAGIASGAALQQVNAAGLHAVPPGEAPHASLEALSGQFAPLVVDGDKAARRGDAQVSARQFGAVGDGVTDDTGALQAFLDYLTTHHKQGYLPGFNYLVKSTLVVSSSFGWGLRGNGQAATRITQDTDNIPVIQLGRGSGTQLHHYSLSDFWLTYTNPQPKSNTKAIGVLLYDMAYWGDWRNIGFNRGFYGIQVRAGIGNPWGTTWDNLGFGAQLTGGAMDWSHGINGTPNNHFGRIFVEMNEMAGPVFAVRGYNFTIDTIEFIQSKANTPKLFAFGDGTFVQIGTIKVENSPISSAGNLIEVAGGSYVSIGHLSWRGGGRATGHLREGAAYLFSIGAGRAGDSRVQVGSIDMHLAADSTSALYVMRCGHADVQMVIDRIRLNDGWKAIDSTSNSMATECLTVSEWVNGKIAARDDADLSIQLRDPNINRFSTAFTGPREIILPADPSNIHSGLFYEFIFDGAINGRNTATITAGGATLRIISSDKTIIRYTWQRTRPTSAGWVITSYQALP